MFSHLIGKLQIKRGEMDGFRLIRGNSAANGVQSRVERQNGAQKNNPQQFRSVGCLYAALRFFRGEDREMLQRNVPIYRPNPLF
jgi:hypothetical protein